MNQKEKMRGAGRAAGGWEIGAMGWGKEIDARSSCLRHFFSPCLWKTGVLNFRKQNRGIKAVVLVMVIRLLLHGDPQESCTDFSLRGTAC